MFTSLRTAALITATFLSATAVSATNAPSKNELHKLQLAQVLAAEQIVVNKNPGKLAELRQIDEYFDSKLRYVEDAEGTDTWTVATTKGDCEDFALAKREALIAKGWSPDDLKIMLLYSAEVDGGHAVLYSVSQDAVLDIPGLDEHPAGETLTMAQYLRQSHFFRVCFAKDLRPINIPDVSERCHASN